MGLLINGVEVTRIELGGVEVMKIEDNQGRILYEAGPKYLCFESLANGSYVGGNGRSGVSLECSTDKQNWTPWDWEVYTYLNAGEKLYVRGTNSYISTSNNLFRFQMSGSIAASGDLTTILDPDGNVTTLADYCFNSIFNGCSALTTAPDMSSVTSIGEYGCRAMFNDCTSLTTAPNLSNVATAGQWAMAGMFEGCTSLTTAPDLRNLTSVGSYGCLSMYGSCSLMSTVYAPSITTWNTTNFQGWVTSVAMSGTMWKPASLTIPSGRDGIPSGWTTQDYPGSRIATPTITFNNRECDPNDYEGGFDGTGEFHFSCSTPGVTWHYRMAQEYDDGNGNYAFNDITQVGWELTPDNEDFVDSIPWYDRGDGADGQYKIQVYASKSGFADSNVAETAASPNPLDCISPEVDCSDWENMGYASYDDCDCAENGIACAPCSDWEGSYESYDDCMCSEGYPEYCEEEPSEEEPEE